MKKAILLFVLLISTFGFSQSYHFSIATARMAVQRGDLSRAEKIMDEAILKYPDSSECYFQRGGARYFLKKMDLALSDFMEADRLGCAKDDLFKYRGLAYHGVGDFVNAEKDYSDFLLKFPEDTVIQIKRAFVIFEQARYQESKSIAEKYITNNKKHIEARIALGLIYYDLGDFQERVSALTGALEIVPEHPLIYCLRAKTFLALGDSVRYCEDLFNAIQLGDKSLINTFNAADCSSIINQFVSDEPLNEFNIGPPPAEVIVIEEK